MRKYVVYYPDATDGILAEQRADIKEHVRWRQHTILGEYTEQPQRGVIGRTELTKALKHVNRAGAVLLIARLGELSRDIAFLAALRRSKVEVTACDAPNLYRWAIPALEDAAVAQARRRSERTRAGLLAYKACGGKLGTPANLTPEARHLGQVVGSRRNSELARSAYLQKGDLIQEMQRLRSEGASLREIAERLTRLGYRTRRRALWNHNQVKRVLDRFQPSSPFNGQMQPTRTRH